MKSLKWKLLNLVFTLLCLALLYSPFYLLNKRFGGNSFKDSIWKSFTSFKNSWLEYVFIFSSIVIIGLLGTLGHSQIVKKKGVAYKIISLLANISMIYLGTAIFFQSIESLKLMYNENFKLLCFTIVCIVICIYYFLIKKDIIN
jgi:hypothetical protein